MRDVQISEGALEDLNDGYLFYEAQASGLGEYFTACLRADIEGLRISAGIHRVVYRDYHPLLSRVFPLRDLLRDRAAACGDLGRY